MKIRAGFVSNSSSSSFILRGMKLTSEEIIEKLKISKEEMDEVEEGYDLYEFLSDKLDGFDIEVDGNYFGGRDYNVLVVGKSLGRLEDGEVTEISDSTDVDKTLIEKFEALGFTGKLKTYVQMISNDNY